MTLSAPVHTDRETRLRRAVTLSRPTIAPSTANEWHQDSAQMWRQSPPNHVEAVFRRIIAALGELDQGEMAALQFTLFLGQFTAEPRAEGGGESAEPLSTILGQPVRAQSPRPIGTALIVSAPSCDALTVAENVAAALAARNCVELALFEQLSAELAALITAVQHEVPSGIFTVLSEQTGWGSRGPQTAIVILTPDRAFVNDSPWVMSRGTSTQRELVAFYSR